jgi:hypothetical protein
VDEPRTYDEYLGRYHDNTRVEGYGLDLATVTPCPFCAAADYMTLYPVAGITPGDERPNIDEQMRTEHTCGECGRAGRFEVVRTDDSVMAEFVQTGGTDPPRWLKPAPRRAA